MEKTEIEIFTDGACSGNPGPGGWGVLLRCGTVVKELSGYDPDTTNNRMELMAAIEALRALNRPCKVSLCTDSQYVKNGITQWIFSWKRRNWETSSGEPVKNQDLWQTLDQIARMHNVQWKWVKGHDGHTENERCDQLARDAIRKKRGCAVAQPQVGFQEQENRGYPWSNLRSGIQTAI